MLVTCLYDDVRRRLVVETNGPLTVGPQQQTVNTRGRDRADRFEGPPSLRQCVGVSLQRKRHPGHAKRLCEATRPHRSPPPRGHVYTAGPEIRTHDDDDDEASKPRVPELKEQNAGPREERRESPLRRVA